VRFLPRQTATGNQAGYAIALAVLIFDNGRFDSDVVLFDLVSGDGREAL